MTGPAVPEPWVPTYYVTCHLNDMMVGGCRQPIPDPLARTEVVVGWRDVLRLWLHRRNVRVVVRVGAGDARTEEAVLALNPDHLGYEGTPSRKAWDARLHESLKQM